MKADPERVSLFLFDGVVSFNMNTYATLEASNGIG
jgi:hypothetical protein